MNNILKELRDKQQKQFEALPSITAKIAKGHKTSCGCGEGWNNLLKRLDEDLTKLDPNYVILQFKEKFGTLRYYCSYKSDVSDQFNKRIEEAEKESETTCETCGGCGRLRGGNWLRTLCDKCESSRTNKS